MDRTGGPGRARARIRIAQIRGGLREARLKLCVVIGSIGRYGGLSGLHSMEPP